MSSQKVKIESFLKENIEFFVNHIFEMYPITKKYIEKYKDKLDWERLSCNEHLKWSKRLIFKYRDYWDWECLSGNEALPWSDRLIIKFEDYWHWKEKENTWDCCLAENESVKWSYKILKKYPERIDWGMISERTELLNKYPKILLEFPNNLFWDSISGNEFINFNDHLIENLASYWNWDMLSGNRAIHWTCKLISKFDSKFNLERYTKGNNEIWLKYKHDKNSFFRRKIDPDELKEKYTPEHFAYLLKKYPEWNKWSCDSRVPWSIDLLEKYKRHWNWQLLSLYSDVPWSIDLIDRFKDKVEWGHEELTPEGYISISSGLTTNPALPWSFDLIKKFEEYWYWPDLSCASYIPWSLELLEEFQEKWVWDHLTRNKSLWEKVFYPELDGKTIDTLLYVYFDTYSK